MDLEGELVIVALQNRVQIRRAFGGEKKNLYTLELKHLSSIQIARPPKGLAVRMICFSPIHRLCVLLFVRS